MEKKDFQKNYKKDYNNKNKIITFPLSNDFFNELKKRAIYFDLTTNSYSKKIITNFLNQSALKILTYEQKKFINDYIHISRWIANNINQIAYKTNIDKQIDVNILIDTLKLYEEEFKKFINKNINYDNKIYE